MEYGSPSFGSSSFVSSRVGGKAEGGERPVRRPQLARLALMTLDVGDPQARLRRDGDSVAKLDDGERRPAPHQVQPRLPLGPRPLRQLLDHVCLRQLQHDAGPDVGHEGGAGRDGGGGLGGGGGGAAPAAAPEAAATAAARAAASGRTERRSIPRPCSVCGVAPRPCKPTDVVQSAIRGAVPARSVWHARVAAVVVLGLPDVRPAVAGLPGVIHRSSVVLVVVRIGGLPELAGLAARRLARRPRTAGTSSRRRCRPRSRSEGQALGDRRAAPVVAAASATAPGTRRW